jgi:hypothetical protein
MHTSDRKDESPAKWRLGAPAAIAGAVAVFGLLAMLVVDHGPWSKPQIRTAEFHQHTTSEAARAAGATVTPTPPRPPMEPKAPGPKSVQPAVPGGS